MSAVYYILIKRQNKNIFAPFNIKWIFFVVFLFEYFFTLDYGNHEGAVNISAFWKETWIYEKNGKKWKILLNFFNLHVYGHGA